MIDHDAEVLIGEASRALGLSAGYEEAAIRLLEGDHIADETLPSALIYATLSVAAATRSLAALAVLELGQD